MADYAFSVIAEDDFDAITTYTAVTYDVTQAVHYTDAILDGAQRLADFPSLGRPYTTKGGRVFQRYNIGRHVLFYQVADEGILIVRILHQAMDFDNYLSG